MIGLVSLRRNDHLSDQARIVHVVDRVRPLVKADSSSKWRENPGAGQEL